MNPRNTAVLFVVFLAIAGFLYFYEVRGGEERREAEEQTTRIFPGLEATDIEAIWLYAGHAVTRVEREEGGWKLISPVEFPGDDLVLDGIASAFAQLTRETEIESPQPPEVYGLGDDSFVIYFTANGEDHGLRLGAKTPVGDGQYVVPASQDPSERVYTVASWRVNAIQKDLDDIRDKRVLEFDRENVEGIRVEWQPDGFIELRKVGDDWRMLRPIDDEADAKTVDRLLSDLAFMRAEGFEDEPIPDDHSGLDAPGMRFELKLAGEEEPLVLELGAFPVGQFILARTVHPSLYEISLERIADFPRRVVAYRDKSLADFDPDEADAVELRFRAAEPGGEPLVVTLEKGESGWSGGDPEVAPERAADLVDALARLGAADIVADGVGDAELAGLGLDPPAVSITVLGRTSESGYGVRLAEVEIGVADADRGIIARNPGASKIVRLDWALAEQIPVHREAYENRFLATESEEEEDDSPDAVEALVPETASP